VAEIQRRTAQPRDVRNTLIQLAQEREPTWRLARRIVGQFDWRERRICAEDLDEQMWPDPFNETLLGSIMRRGERIPEAELGLGLPRPLIDSGAYIAYGSG
jgi:hypothetical protein